MKYNELIKELNELYLKKTFTIDETLRHNYLKETLSQKLKYSKSPNWAVISVSDNRLIDIYFYPSDQKNEAEKKFKEILLDEYPDINLDETLERGFHLFYSGVIECVQDFSFEVNQYV